MWVFIGDLSLSTIRWVPCQGFSPFSFLTSFRVDQVNHLQHKGQIYLYHTAYERKHAICE